MTDTKITPAKLHFEKAPCGRCGGCGMFGPKSVKGGACFQCGGSGKRLTRRGETARKRYDEMVTARLGRPVWELREGDVVWAHYSTWAGFTPVDSPKAWRTIARVEWTEQTDSYVITKNDDGTEERTPLAEGRIVFVTPEGKTERTVATAARRDYFDTWLFPVYDRDALVEIMREISRRYTGAWLDGEEPPAPAVRKPKAAPAAEERQEDAEPAPKPLAVNKFAGQCRKCGTRVEAEQGERERVEGRWAVQHKDGECPAAEEGREDAEEQPQREERPAQPNRFGGRCADCDVWVEEGKGERVMSLGRWITRHPKGQCPKTSTVKVTEEGLYRLPGDGPLGGGVFRVRRSERSGRLYAETLTPHAKEGGGARFVYDPAAVYVLEPAHRMSVEEAAEIGRKLHTCMQCGEHLTDPKSVARGIGPVCAKKV